MFEVRRCRTFAKPGFDVEHLVFTQPSLVGRQYLGQHMMPHIGEDTIQLWDTWHTA